MTQRERIVHSIPPTFDERSRVLVLGTMPSPASREAGFNYGHPRNRFWPVMARLAGEALPEGTERRRDFCLRHHIALWDVLAECDIEGASDASIANAVPNRLTDITHTAPIEAVFCTGAKSFELYNRYCAGKVGIPAVKLPSTSPANAACSTDRLLREYAAIFDHEHPFTPPTLEVAQVVALEQTIAANGTSLFELMDRAGHALAWRIQEILEQIASGTYPSKGKTFLSASIDSKNKSSLAVPDSAQPPAPAEGLCGSRETSSNLVTLLCGNGNNGGDGWVAAALLAQRGVNVCVVCAKLPEALTAQPAHDAALRALATLEELGCCVVDANEARSQLAGTNPIDGQANGQQLGADPSASAIAKASICHGKRNDSMRAPIVLVDVGSSEDKRAVERILRESAIVVDAIMGTGAAKAPRSPFREWVISANALRDHHVTLAVDVPTGIDANTGEVADPHLPADETITMIVPKTGLFAAACGPITVAPLAYIERYF